MQIEFLIRGINVNHGDNTDRLNEAHSRYMRQCIDALSSVVNSEEEDGEPVEEVQLGDIILVCRNSTVLEEMNEIPFCP